MLDRFLSLLSGCRPAGPVWTADISYWISGRQQDGTADEAWKTEEGYLRLHSDLDVMPYYYYDKFWVAEPVYDDSIQTSAGTFQGKDFRVLQSPAGTLREESVFLPESSCHGITKHMVQSEEDLDVLLYVLDRRRLESCNVADYAERRELWARYDGLPCLGLPRSPLSSLAYEWCGIQALVMLMSDCEEKVRHALRMLEQQESPIIDAVCELKPPLVHFPDNLSSDNFTGYYGEYMRDRHAERLKRLHTAGIKAAVHLDGTVKGLLVKLIDNGFDAVEALTPKPAGDLTADEMAAIAGDSDAILWGGVPGVMFAPPYTWDDMRDHVLRVLDEWGDRRFILGVADQVPPDGDIEYCMKIRELVGG